VFPGYETLTKKVSQTFCYKTTNYLSPDGMPLCKKHKAGWFKILPSQAMSMLGKYMEAKKNGK
jgi:hypothetical protein